MKNKKLSFLKNFEKKAHELLIKNYSEYFFMNYEIEIIENVMCNGSCHFVAVFKDFLISDDDSEYLHRFYKENESFDRLIKLFAYYFETSVIFPNYTPLIESKYLYDNVIKKQNVIDEQQNIEDEKKFKMNNKNKKNKEISPLRKIENIFKNEEEDTLVFNSKVYEDILNTSESLQRIIFGIDNKKNNNKRSKSLSNNDQNKLKSSEKIYENDSIKKLIKNIDKFKNVKKNKKLMFYNHRNKTKYSSKILNNKKYKSLQKENITKKNNIKDNYIPFKRNRTININININNIKNNYAMTAHPYIDNNRKNKFFSFSNNKENLKEKILFNYKKMHSTIPFQAFRCTNYISYLKTSNQRSNINDMYNNNFQQKLIEIFNKKIKKNKNKQNKKNDSNNLSLGKTINSSRFRNKNRAFILNTIQNSIKRHISRRNNSKSTKSDKAISFKKRKGHHNTKTNSKNNSINDKIKKRNVNNLSAYNKKIKTQLTNNNNDDINKKIINNKKYFTNFINKPMMTISSSYRKKNIFDLNTVSKFTETIHDYKNKRKNIKEYNHQINLNHIIRNSSLKNKVITKKKNC